MRSHKSGPAPALHTARGVQKAHLKQAWPDLHHAEPSGVLRAPLIRPRVRARISRRSLYLTADPFFEALARRRRTHVTDKGRLQCFAAKLILRLHPPAWLIVGSRPGTRYQASAADPGRHAHAVQECRARSCTLHPAPVSSRLRPRQNLDHIFWKDASQAMSI